MASRPCARYSAVHRTVMAPSSGCHLGVTAAQCAYGKVKAPQLESAMKTPTLPLTSEINVTPFPGRGARADHHVSGRSERSQGNGRPALTTVRRHLRVQRQLQRPRGFGRRLLCAESTTDVSSAVDGDAACDLRRTAREGSPGGRPPRRQLSCSQWTQHEQRAFA